jgi:septal ring factor EnvC (AmiA/AmiB activator)
MKSFLVLLVIVLTGLVFAVWHFSTRPTEAHRAIIAGLKEELKDSESERDRLVSELAQAKAALERLSGAPPASIGAFDEPTPPVVLAPVTPGPSVPASALDGRLRELSDIYHRNHAELLKKKAGYEASLESSRERRKVDVEAPMSFSEQTETTDTEGNVTGMRGVRTSTADRERTIAKRDDQIAQIDAEIKKLSTQIAGVDAEMKRLDEFYKNAVAKAKGELSNP